AQDPGSSCNCRVNYGSVWRTRVMLRADAETHRQRRWVAAGEPVGIGNSTGAAEEHGPSSLASLACAGGRLDARVSEITFTTELEAPSRVTAFPYADLLRVYLLFSPGGDISIVVNARSAIQTFDGCESSDAARRFLAAVSSHGVATEESGFAAARESMRTSSPQPEPPPMLAATRPAMFAAMQQPQQPSSAPRPAPSRNAVAGVACGVGVAILGAALWAGLAYATHYRLSLIGVGIGLGIAFVFKRFGLCGQAFAIVAA